MIHLIFVSSYSIDTGRRSCFFRAARGSELVTIADPLVTPGELYGDKD